MRRNSPIGPIRSLWARAHRRGMTTFLAFALAAAVALGKWLVLPWYFSPYVRVPATSFSLALRCVPSWVRISSLTSYASLLNAQLVISDVKSQKVIYTYNIPVSPGSYGNFELTPSQYETGQAFDEFNQNTAAALDLQFSRMPFLDISRADLEYFGQSGSGACAAEKLTGSDLARRIAGGSPRAMRVSLIQDRLSDILLGANELIGNILLCCLVISLFWIGTWVALGFFLMYFVPDRMLMRLVTRSNVAALPDSEKKDLISNIKMEYSKVYRRLAFARVVGPATGFLLTVTSLVAGLHPSVVARQDTFHFISSLQLALVATFMGLLVRIASEFAIRFHRDAALRRLDLIG